MSTEGFLILSAILFTIGLAGFLLRRNSIIMFMSIELMLTPPTWPSWHSRASTATCTA